MERLVQWVNEAAGNSTVTFVSMACSREGCANQ